MSRPSEFEDTESPIWAKINELEDKIDTNTVLTQQVADNTSELISVFEAFKGAFKVLEFLGKIARPVLWIAGVPTTVYAAWLGIRAFFKSLGN